LAELIIRLDRRKLVNSEPKENFYAGGIMKRLNSIVIATSVWFLATSSVSVFAQSTPVIPASVTVGDCEHLPTRDEFVKTDYDKATIGKIQQCLKVKGFYNAPVYGVKGPLTIAALEKYQTQKTATNAPYATSVKVDCNGLPSKELFVKQVYDVDTIKLIQGCLAVKGFYKGALDGIKGPALIDALGKSQAPGPCQECHFSSSTNTSTGSERAKR